MFAPSTPHRCLRLLSSQRCARQRFIAPQVAPPSILGLFLKRPVASQLDSWRLILRRCAASGTVVVVESPAKAVKIQQYLGNDFQVLASLGHVCDLPSKAGAVDVADSFAVKWELSERGAQQLQEISEALKDANRLILATDPDREGEAISWHVIQQLKTLCSLQNKTIQRIAFNQISQQAILDAMQHPRSVSSLQRPLHGRVQSPCLRLICEREDEILNFKAKEYWSIDAVLTAQDSLSFKADLTYLEGKRLQKFALSTEQRAQSALSAVQQAELSVKKVEEKTARERPLAPYRTSTLQQDAAVKLRWSSKKTMDVAQKLYDGRNNTGPPSISTQFLISAAEESSSGGLITYMRTDGVAISPESIGKIRATIQTQFGEEYLAKKPRVHSTKVLNAQEAHEAIHPIKIELQESDLAASVTSEERKLYQLIWERTVASQMSDALYCQRSADVEDSERQIRLRSTARKATFKGFTAAYRKASEGDEEASSKQSTPTKQFQTLGKIKEGDLIQSITPEMHEHSTKPPPRYTEASIVKTMETLGIGRPSTFASITALLITRKYVRKIKQRFFPQPLGRVLSVYLEHQFREFIDYQFTAEMETRLDDIATGKESWQKVAQEFWDVLDPSVQQALTVQVRDIIDYVNAQVLQSVFLPLVTEEKPLEAVQKCPLCEDGKLMIKFSKYGPFMGCDHYNASKCSYKCSMAALGKEKEEKTDTET